MNIYYDRHAKRRMKEREVEEYEVKSVIEDPDYIEPSIKGRINAFKLSNNRYLRVTFKKINDDSLLIITVTIRKKPFRRDGYEN